MQVGDFVHGGYYAGDHDGHHIICSPIEYELPFEFDWHQAINYCKALGMELPTKEELNLLYELSKLVPDQFRTGEWSWYWSSSEYSSTCAWSQSFNNGYQNDSSKTYSNCVRPIKRIKISEDRILT